MNAQQKKVLGCLNNIYELTRHNHVHLISRDIISNHSIDQKIWQLISCNFVDRKKNGLKYYYKWKTIKPNLKMVDKCIKELKEENDNLRLKYKINIISGDSKPRIDFINYFKLKLSDDYYNFSLDRLMKEFNVTLTFTQFLIYNNYILIEDSSTSTRLYKYKWNNKKSFTELKKLILEADISKVKTQIKNFETKIVNTKPKKVEPIREIKKDTHREEVIKEYRDKSISILWGLIKIKY